MMPWFKEEVRQTEAQRELSETERERMDRKLSRIAEMIENGEHPQVTLTCFVPDERKAGGSYEEAAGRVKRIDPVEGRIIFYAANGISNGVSVEIGRIVGIGFEGADGTR